jgi:hypothetical protein
MLSCAVPGSPASPALIRDLRAPLEVLDLLRALPGLVLVPSRALILATRGEEPTCWAPRCFAGPRR